MSDSSHLAVATLRGPGRPGGGRSGEGRVALLRAARELMAEKGSTRLTSKEVGERARVKPTLVNYYFGNRDGLLQAVISAIAQETATRLENAVLTRGSIEERLRAIVGAVLYGFVDEPYSARLLFEQVIFGNDEIQDRFVDEFGRAHINAIRSILDAGSADATLRRVDPALAVSAIGGVCTFLTLMMPLLGRVLDVDPLSPQGVDQMAESVTDLLLHGLIERSEVHT
jgi:AcrR family transcriptional regulator